MQVNWSWWCASLIIAYTIRRSLTQRFKSKALYLRHANRFYAKKLVAELVGTSAAYLAFLDGKIPERFRPSSYLAEASATLYWAAELSKSRNRAEVLSQWLNEERELLQPESALLIIFSFALLVSQRVFASAIIVFFLVQLYYYFSHLKYKFTRVNLHAYDLISYLSPKAIRLFLKTSPSTLRSLIFSLVAAALALTALIYIEPVSVDRPSAAAMLAGCTMLFAVFRRYLIPPAKWNDYSRLFEQAPNPTAFIDSIFESVVAWRRGGVLARSSAPSVEAFRQEVRENDATAGAYPNIIVILHESTFPPELFQKTSTDPISQFFSSNDGTAHSLRVETFGGATWKSEFSVMTGIPASAYGAFADHVFYWAVGKIRHSLPLRLKEYGYRNIAIIPTDRFFFGAADFFSSIGIDRIFDKADMSAPTDYERDRFYYSFALKFLRDSLDRNESPLFLYISTMWNHFDHNVYAIAPDGEPRTTKVQDSEFAEYLRRLQHTCADYSDFRTAIEREFPDREFLIVRFGDHQPPFTAQLINSESKDFASNREDDALYRTFFSLDTVNFTHKISYKLPAEIEIGYLSTVILDAAGIPGDELTEVRRKLMLENAGRLFFVDMGETVRQLNEKMVMSGLVEPH